jgi:hypothetical protein
MPSRISTQKVAYPAVRIATAGVLAALVLPAAAVHAGSCVTKHGSATGITRGFAEYEAFLIIRQVTGNWPFQQDRISEPAYKCKSDGALWTCSATATVCRD